jgi:hypothetical protein
MISCNTNCGICLADGRHRGAKSRAVRERLPRPRRSEKNGLERSALKRCQPSGRQRPTSALVASCERKTWAAKKDSRKKRMAARSTRPFSLPRATWQGRVWKAAHDSEVSNDGPPPKRQTPTAILAEPGGLSEWARPSLDFLVVLIYIVLPRRG